MIRQKEKPYQLFAVLGFVMSAICFYFLCDLGILKSNKLINEIILRMNFTLLGLYLIGYWAFNEVKKLFDYIDNSGKTNENK